MKNFAARFISQILIISMLSMSIWVPNAQATLITTEQVAGNQAAQQDRERVRAFFDREDVKAQLQARGVSSEAAKARVDALTDNEVASIAGHIDSLPAGGDVFGGLIGALVFVFIVLLITDILGLTKVFSFTKTIRR
ncbi:MAG TPA: PA2779 family protein [Gallionellaceae bacterium]|nr:PA2779 family protein [Gallionellaceae bacterium]